MHALILQTQVLMLRRRDESTGSGFGCFVALLVVGIIVFLVLKGRRDREEQLGAAKRPMGSGPLEAHTFANPYGKCPACGASGDKMRQQYDGLRKVTWTCGYCGAVAGVQELRDEELPPSVRQQMGMGMPQGMYPGQPGYYPPQQGSGLGGIMTGMMIGSMLGGGHERRDDGWGDSHRGGGDWGDGGGSSSGGDWGEGGGSGGGGGDWGDSGGGGGDWGDSGGGDSGSDF